MKEDVESEGHEVSTLSSQAKVGDRFSFVVKIDGQRRKLIGTVAITMSSTKARELGLTQSHRTRTVLGLKVEGYNKLFYKDRGQVKRVVEDD